MINGVDLNLNRKGDGDINYENRSKIGRYWI